LYALLSREFAVAYEDDGSGNGDVAWPFAKAAVFSFQVLVFVWRKRGWLKKEKGMAWLLL
jgi:hypothetical protein